MNNVNGILLVIAAMAAFTIEDVFVKELSVTVSTGQILLVLGLVTMCIFLTMSLVTRKRIFSARAWGPLPLFRTVAEATASVAFVTSLSLVDLSTVAAVFQAMPLVATTGAALFLGEQVGWRRWSAIGVGFVGVLMIIRPGLEAFDADTLYVVVAVVAVAARDLITRKIDHSVASSVVAMQAYLALAVVGAGLMITTPGSVSPLLPGHLWLYAGALSFGVFGYYGIILAMRVGEASVVIPFRYTRLLFSIIAGMMVFGERPDLLTFAGSALIIGSGMYTFIRERRLARELTVTV